MPLTYAAALLVNKTHPDLIRFFEKEFYDEEHTKRAVDPRRCHPQ